ncbi:Serine/threonine-protein kinase PrkC [Aeoliella mucimassa]|uniref:Serine/threonine-protein kinase PrkC n=2 Tax=Aeoliella mucimassa TaxID=2527972 RepID=A0A518ASH2_9BACT|nr:Serine/threonine-protein kinase PrkC [Aeoliella mucimassa]
MEVGILDHRQLQVVRGELGTRSPDLATMSQELLRRNLLTQYQLERLVKGLQSGFFYGKYKVLYCVGAGSFARVFRAVHVDTNEVFAVKVLRNRCITEYADSFRREGELGASLKHPNIVPIHEVYSKRDVHYIVMDFIEGRNLREFTRVRRVFAPLEAAKILDGMLAGLNYAFQQGVSHRDLKMSNVLVSSEGESKLLDFGLAAIESDVAGDTGVKRTVEYAALERATGVRKDDARSDIFFAGCIFYHMLSGRSPMPEGRDRAKQLSKETFQNIPPIASVAPKVPPTFAKVINRAIEFDPEKRYQTPLEMLTDLKIAAKRLAERGATQSVKNELASNEGHNEQGEPRRLMVVESNVKMQDVLRNLFKQHGYRVLVASDPERAIDRFYTDSDAAEVVLFSSGHNGRATLEAFNRFATESGTRDIPAILLLDEAHATWEPEANVSDHRLTITMPIKQRELRQAVRKVLSRQAV